MNTGGWFPLGWTGLISLLSKGLSRVFSSTQFKSINFLVFSLLQILIYIHMLCSPGEGNGNAIQYSGPKKSTDREGLVGYSPWGRRVGHSWVIIIHSCYIMGFLGGTSGKESACQCRRCKRHVIFPGSGRSPGGGHSNPLQYSCLENPMANYNPYNAQSQTLLKQLILLLLYKKLFVI